MIEALIYSSCVSNVKISERVKIYEASYSVKKNNFPEYVYFSDIIKLIPERDKVEIFLSNQSEEIFTITRDSDFGLYEKFIKDTFDEEEVTIKINIEKSINEDRLSIYSFNSFCDDLLSLSVEDIMKVFSNLLKETKGKLIFDVYSSFSTFTTKTIFFIPHESNLVSPVSFNRKKRIESCREVSYFYNFDVCEVIPDDFKIEINFEGNPLTEIFNRLEALLSIVFIGNSSSIQQKNLNGVISGQRSVEYNYELDNTIKNENLYKIYNWIYTDGCTVDKAIIARNVVSLHCKQTPVIELDESIFASIQSNYNLYLKDNVIQYLELKNKVAEFICEEVSKTGEYATKLLDKFKTNLFAIFGFLFTTVLANIVSDQPLDNIFTKDITMLFELVLLGSFIYLYICYKQSKYEIERVEESYVQLKESYKNILTELDLNEVFNNDIVFNNAKEHIKNSRKQFIFLWVIALVLGFVWIEYIGEEAIFTHLVQYVMKQ